MHLTQPAAIMDIWSPVLQRAGNQDGAFPMIGSLPSQNNFQLLGRGQSDVQQQRLLGTHPQPLPMTILGPLA
jgi:hypothetical protein